MLSSNLVRCAWGRCSFEIVCLVSAARAPWYLKAVYLGEECAVVRTVLIRKDVRH